MQKNKILNNIKLVITVAIIAAFVWFLVVSPMMKFHANEKEMEEAAKRYFEINSNQLPTGERIKTVSLSDLYKGSYLKKDFYAPYSSKTCSIGNSWVKVKRVNGEYEYYVYLECGVLNSSIDHKGPEIKLNGNTEMTLNVDEKYEEPGVKSIVDNSDGKISNDKITIKGSVDTSKVGTYEIEYIASDSLNNKTTVKREVKVVKTFKNVVEKALGKNSNFVGEPNNNYARLSNMVFRIYGFDDDKNVIIVADQDIANVNYTKIDEWLDYYYAHLNKKTKNMIVDSKFCNMDLTDTTLDTVQCNSYTKKRKVYIPSVIEVNKTQGEGNFMKTNTMSWVANKKSDKEAFLTRNIFFGDEYGKSFLAYDATSNYGVRPMMVIKGDSLVTGGDGTLDNPYQFGDSKRAEGSSLVNTRYTGEFIENSGTLWRIVDVMDDGTTKVISQGTFGNKFNDDDSTIFADPENEKIVYNPKDKNSVAYYINNNASKFIDTKIFINHTIEVPIYKDKIIYGEEVETKKYKAKLSAPNMYEMFSAQSNVDAYYGDSTVSRSYWLCNTSKAKGIAGALTDIGVPMNEKIEPYSEFGIRVVAYIKSDSIISSGNGTAVSPYKVK